MRRGELWWASLPLPAGRRPVVVIQSNPFNESAIGTVVVLLVTSNLGLARARGNLRISRGQSGLSKPSVINVSQIHTIDKDRLTERVKALPAEVMAQVDEGMKVVLGLQGPGQITINVVDR
jgi:mRNA interferase MazF